MQEIMDKLKQKITVLVATFFWTGKVGKAPGTMGTLATIPLWLILVRLPVVWYMTVVIALTLVGIFAAQAYEHLTNKHDAKEIVIDEVVGFLITLTWLPVTWQTVLGGFILFRFFDIIKPWPIKMLDQKVKGGVGVMIDDIAAGLISSIILQIIYTQTSWLGAQIQTF
jgi:phosphatidylglycerophosphatase A